MAGLQTTGRYSSFGLMLLAMLHSVPCFQLSAMPSVYSGIHPEVHFTPVKGWMNDPNGLVYYDGEYHLFFQSCEDKRSGPRSWGHAVSKNLFAWQQLEDALVPSGGRDVWSGSIVIDDKNSSGLHRAGYGPPMVALYTNHSEKFPTEQTLAVSHDKGRTWLQPGQPVIPHFESESRRDARDPKVQWHEPSKQWIMVLYVEKGVVLLYCSTDLHSWHVLQEIEFDDGYETPDFFELHVESESPHVTYWILMMADGSYQIGTFDGKQFVATSSIHKAEYGIGYASTTFTNEPNGHRVQMAWMRPLGRQLQLFDDVPFLSILTTPMELVLVRDDSLGLYIRRQPVQQLATLRQTPLLQFEGATQLDVSISEDQVGLKSQFSKACGLDVIIEAFIPLGGSLALSLQSGRHQSKNHGVRVNLARSEGDKKTAVLQALAEEKAEMRVRVLQGELVTMRLVVDWGTLEIFDSAGQNSMALYALDLAILTDKKHCSPQFVELVEVQPNRNQTMPQVQRMEVYQLQA